MSWLSKTNLLNSHNSKNQERGRIRVHHIDFRQYRCYRGSSKWTQTRETRVQTCDNRSADFIDHILVDACVSRSLFQSSCLAGDRVGDHAIQSVDRIWVGRVSITFFFAVSSHNKAECILSEQNTQTTIDLSQERPLSVREFHPNERYWRKSIAKAECNLCESYPVRCCPP